MKAKNQERGFTLIELILVITVLGILAVAAIPSFINVNQQAATNARDNVVGAVRAGIALQRAQDFANGGTGTPPAQLDLIGNVAADSDNPLFTDVMQEGVRDGSWSKTGAHVYVYTMPDATTQEYTYTPATGSFVESEAAE